MGLQSPATNGRQTPRLVVVSGPDDGLGLCERDAEIDQLAAAVGSVASGAGAVVLIEGAAGLGRTALLGGVRHRARTTGFQVLSARGGRAEQQFDFAVARQLLESVPARVGGEPMRWPEPIPAAEDAAAWFAVLRELYDRVVGVASSAPVLLVVDDCQWADAASLRFLGFLARRLDTAQVGIVLAVRDPVPAAIAPVLTELHLGSNAVRLRLQPLGVEATASIVRRRLGPAGGAAVCAACHTVTGGNPRLLDELLRELTCTAEPGPDLAMVHAAAPIGVALQVGLEVGSASAPAEELVRALAVLGGAELHVAAVVAGIDHPAAVLAANVLLAEGVVEQTETGLRFAHPIVRRALEKHLPPQWRSAAHLRAARLAVEHSACAATVAEHLMGTDPGQNEWVVEQLGRAAAEAAGRRAWTTALRYLRRALAEPPTAARRAELLGAMAVAAARCGDPLGPQLTEALVLRSDVGLTAGELRVVECVVEGRTNREAAGTLCVSVKTVEMHLSNAYRKLGITARVQLVAALAGDGRSSSGR